MQSQAMMRAARALALTMMLIMAASAGHAHAQPAEPPAAEDPAPAEPVYSPRPFVDYFETLDETRWFVSDGWSNGDWMANDFRRTQLSITPEGLTITMARNPTGAPKPYSSGEIRTFAQYRYGYFEARMRVPRGSGHVTGLFTYTSPEGRASWNEIDIEILGRNTRQIELVYWNGGRSKGRRVQLPFDAADGFHTYGFEWRPDRLRWYADNRLIASADPRELALPTRPSSFFLEFWNSQTMVGWVGPVRPQHAPWVLTVSCMAQAERYEGRSLCQSRNPNAAAR